MSSPERRLRKAVTLLYIPAFSTMFVSSLHYNYTHLLSSFTSRVQDLKLDLSKISMSKTTKYM